MWAASAMKEDQVDGSRLRRQCIVEEPAAKQEQECQ
jgi:hypothetical protein